MNEAGVSFSRHPISKLDTRYVNTAGDTMTGALIVSPSVTVPLLIAPSTSLALKPTTNATTAIQLQNAAGTSILNVDTTNGRVGIGTTAPGYQLTLSKAVYGGQLVFQRPDDTTANGWIQFLGTSGSSVTYGSAIQGYGGGFKFYTDSTPADTSDNSVESLTILNSGNVGIGITAPLAKLHIDQSSTTLAKPVLILDQADIDEDFFKFIGASDTSVDRALVDAVNFPTPGAIVGWLKINIQDDQATGPITNGDYFIPFYAAPTA